MKSTKFWETINPGRVTQNQFQSNNL